MELAIAAVVVVVIAVAVRRLSLNRVVRQRHAEPFDGVVYRVGSAAIAERRCDHPVATVICMHGFCEDLRYFTRHYADPRLQLILVNSGDYHLPIANPTFADAPWVRQPTAAEGSIEYDAQVLVQALEFLPKTPSIRLHGHSRGGAVLLEAAALRPDLFKRAEVVMEAPVLPRGKAHRAPSRLGLWLLPFLVPLWRLAPLNPSNRRIWGDLGNPRKRELLEGLPFNPRRIATMAANIRSIEEWARRRDVDLYRNIDHGVVLVPEHDMVLDADAMAESAAQAGAALKVVLVPGASHFVLQDRPEVIPPAMPVGIAAGA